MIIGLSAFAAEDVTSAMNELIIDEIPNEADIPRECCSFVIQREYNQTIFSFRQDSPVDNESLGLRIDSEKWNGHEIIKQKVDAKENYFFHTIIVDNGWVIGQGGSQHENNNEVIEQIALNMVAKKEITGEDLQEVSNILASENYGHLLIKAPDGRYGVVVQDKILMGKLEQGEYIVAPNEQEYIDMGNYTDYGDDPVQAIIEICSWDKSGENIREQMVYNYRPQYTFDGMYYGVDIYSTNCNGKNIGLDKADCVVPFKYEGFNYPTSSIPEYPNKIYVGTYFFKNKTINSIPDLVGHKITL